MKDKFTWCARPNDNLNEANIKEYREMPLYELLKLMDSKKGKLYTAGELDEVIKIGWRTREELYALYSFVENAKMLNDEELERLEISGWINVITNAYEVQRWLDENG